MTEPDPPLRCPVCAVPLRDAEAHGASMRRCPRCAGLLLANRDLVSILEAISKDLVTTIDPALPIEPTQDETRHAACPRCGQAMVSFGYMGTSEVIVDQCKADQLLWLDADELGVMALLYARTQRRRYVEDRDTRARNAETVRAVGRALVSREMARIIVTVGMG